MRTRTAVFVATVLLGCGEGPRASAGESSTASATQATQSTKADSLTVLVGGRRISLPGDRWRPMANEAEFAKNFEAVTNKPPRQYQILTVFTIQMTEDRKDGREIARGEYMTVFVSNPNEVTVSLQRDHGAYWILSREMFRGIQVRGVNLQRIGPLSDRDEAEVVRVLRSEIDTTRHQLGELIAK